MFHTISQYCKDHGILITAYSPLGSGDSYMGKRQDTPFLLKDEDVLKIAAEVSRTPAQVAYTNIVYY